MIELDPAMESSDEESFQYNKDSNPEMESSNHTIDTIDTDESDFYDAFLLNRNLDRNHPDHGKNCRDCFVMGQILSKSPIMHELILALNTIIGPEQSIDQWQISFKNWIRRLRHKTTAIFNHLRIAGIGFEELANEIEQRMFCLKPMIIALEKMEVPNVSTPRVTPTRKKNKKIKFPSSILHKRMGRKDGLQKNKLKEVADHFSKMRKTAIASLVSSTQHLENAIDRLFTALTENMPN